MNVSRELWPHPTPEKTYVDTHHCNMPWEEHGRFYTPEYESLPTEQAELVDETYGNNIKRMQDSEVNFLRWTYQNRVSRALNSKNRKAQVFLPGTCVDHWRIDKRETKGSFKRHCSSTETRRDSEQEGSTGQIPLMPGGCVWLSRAGRLMRPDPTQLKLASGREEAYQELHDSHPILWTARGELQKLQRGLFLDISTDTPEDDTAAKAATTCFASSHMENSPETGLD